MGSGTRTSRVRSALAGGAAGDPDGRRLLPRSGVPPDLLRAAEDADLVLGSRYVAGGGVRDWGLVRRMISRGGGFYARLILRRRPRSDWRLQVHPAPGTRGNRPAERARRGLCVPDRGHLSGASWQVFAFERSRSCSPTALRVAPRCPLASPSRRCGSFQRCAASARGVARAGSGRSKLLNNTIPMFVKLHQGHVRASCQNECTSPASAIPPSGGYPLPAGGRWRQGRP